MIARVARSQEALRASRVVMARSLHATAAPRSDIDLLQKLLDAAKAREAEEAAAAKAAMAAEAAGGGSKFQIQGFNALSPVGLELFPKSSFWLTGSCGELPDGVESEPHAILLRSHKLQPDEVGDSVRAIARFGAGTNNIPIPEMTARGIPVFNTPGANANSVKELVLAGLLLGARGVVEGIQHVNEKIVPEEKGDFKKIAARIEKDKKHFGGHELVGKTLAIAGLGNIGNLVADAALSLGMNVVGYDPKISVDAAWRVPREVQKASSLTELFSKADYVSINMPYIKGATHHIIDAEVLGAMKPKCNILNFSRAEIIDGAALKRCFDNGHSGKYICDFADEHMQGHPKFICIPHLGASTEEAEDNCAIMGSRQVSRRRPTARGLRKLATPTANVPRPRVARAHRRFAPTLPSSWSMRASPPIPLGRPAPLTLPPTHPHPPLARRQVINFLETGNIVNSVNFPTAQLDRQDASDTRLVSRLGALPRTRLPPSPLLASFPNPAHQDGHLPVLGSCHLGRACRSLPTRSTHAPLMPRAACRATTLDAQVIINNNVPGALGLITTLLGDMGVNITQQLNTSRDTIAYNVIDMQGFPEGEQGDAIQRAIQDIEAVISTRMIFTGSAQEGPRNFFTK